MECPYIHQCFRRKELREYTTRCTGRFYGICKDFQIFRGQEFHASTLRVVEQDESDLVGRLESLGEQEVTIK